MNYKTKIKSLPTFDLHPYQNRKYLIKRQTLVKIFKNSYFSKNIRGFFCRIAFSKKFLANNYYEIKKIHKVLDSEKIYYLENNFLKKKLLCEFENNLKIFSPLVISDKYPTLLEFFLFYKNCKKISIKVFRRKGFFLLRKKLEPKTRNKIFYVRIKLVGSPIF